MDSKKRVMLTEFQQNCAVMISFFVGLVTITFFHEITLDESQAWLIARDASFYDIIFTIPHYEGHPCLWHLLLSVFAKTGAAPSFGLHFWMILMSSIAVGIIVFKSPFPKIVRYLLPFTYYIFYRYAVVARPYCITFLAFILAALFFKDKNKHPVRFVLALMLLSASTAYGMVFAAGICIVWAIEILTHVVKCKKKTIQNEQKFAWIGIFASGSVLIAQNVFQLLSIMPNSDTNAANTYSLGTYVYSLIYMFVIAPADSMFLDSGMDARLQDYAQQIITGSSYSVIYLILGMITTGSILYFFYKQKKLLLYLIPYSMFACFSAFVYLWYHHIGLGFLFLIFAAWASMSIQPDKKAMKLSAEHSTAATEAKPNTNDVTPKQRFSLDRYKGLLAAIAVFLGLGMSVAWNIYDCGIDIKYPIWYNKLVSDAIKDIGADQGNCMLQWTYYAKGEFNSPEEYYDPDNYTYDISLTNFYDCLVYFDKNIFINHNEGNPNISYSMQTVYTGQREEEYREKLANLGYPEFIVGNDIVLGYLPIDEENPGYYPVFRYEVRKPDKFMVDYNDRFIYARKDIYENRQDWPVKEQLSVDIN